jgi:hypothetical protein
MVPTLQHQGGTWASLQMILLPDTVAEIVVVQDLEVAVLVVAVLVVEVRSVVEALNVVEALIDGSTDDDLDRAKRTQCVCVYALEL